MEDLWPFRADGLKAGWEIGLAVRQVRVKIGDRSYTVEVDEPLGSPTRVTVEGETFLVEVEGLLGHSPVPRPSLKAPFPAQLPSGQAPPPAGALSPGLINSPMSGKVLSVTVKPGDEVGAGDEVCVVEAMKMEQSIRAPRAGTIKKVYVTPLQQVNIRAPLVELE